MADMFDWDIVDVTYAQGTTNTTAETIFTADNNAAYIIMMLHNSVTCQLTVDGLSLFPSAGAICTPFEGISGTVTLIEPIPIPPRSSVTIQQIGTTVGTYLLAIGKLKTGG